MENQEASDEGVISPSDFIQMERRQSMSRAITTLGDDPEKAARAAELGSATGVDPSLIHSDLENFEEQHKAALTSSLFNENRFLREYVSSHPLAASISNDDYGQLDKVSQVLRKGLGAVPPFSLLSAATLPETINIVKDQLHGLANLGLETEQSRQLGSEVEKSLTGKGVPPEQAKAEAQHQQQTYIRGEALQAAAFAIPSLALSPIFGLFRQAVSGPIEAKTGFPKEATEQAAMVLGSFFGLKHMGDLQAKAPELLDAVHAAEPYLRSKQDPPLGIHPIIDDMIVEDSKNRLAQLDEALKEAQASATRERAPEIFSSFIRQHTDAKIGVSADAIRKLYGDVEPLEGDGKLGWVPRIREQLATAEATGGDVEIPLSDWLARVEPEIAKELHDDLRVRPGGITLHEAKELEPIEAYHGSPHDFEAFSSEKIGTGEGAQSYGHGLYFAEKPEVAQSYTQNAQQRGMYTINGKKLSAQGVYTLDNAGTPELAAVFALDQAGGDTYRAALTLGAAINREPSLKEFYSQASAMLPDIKPVSAGGMYRVRIHADKEQFLDWDKPLGEQPASIKQSLEPILQELKEDSEGVLANAKTVDYGNMSGQDFYRQMMAYFDSERGEAVSARLHEAGIPGIKYLDQGSRGTKLQALLKEKSDFERLVSEAEESGDKAITASRKEMLNDVKELIAKEPRSTSNFVIFDPSIVEITHKNDQAVASVRSAAKLDPLFEGPGALIPETGASILPPEAIADNAKVHSGFKTINSIYSYTLRDAVNAISTEHLDGVSKALYQFFGEKLKELVGDAKVRVVKHEDLQSALRRTPEEAKKSNAPGYYSPVYHEVVLSDRIVGGQYGEGRAAHIVMHEGAHALTVRAMSEDKALTQHVLDMMKETREFLAEVNPDALREHEYGFKNDREFIAEAFSDPNFQNTLSVTPMSEALAKRMGMTKAKPTVWDAVRDIVKNLLEKLIGIRPSETILDGIFQIGKLVEAKGSVKRKPVGQRAEPQAGPSQPELPGITRMEDREAFDKASAIGMTVDQYKRYMRLIEKRNAEDLEAATKRAEAEQRKRQTKEWRAAKTEIHAEVAKDMSARPDVAADIFFGTGELYGEKLASRPKLQADMVTPEQKARLPQNYFADRGLHPDDAAGLFGYSSGDTMLDALGRYSEAKLKGNMTSKDYLARVVDMETDRRLEAKFGDREATVLSEAKDQALSETQLDLLHEEVLALGLRAGTEYSITKEQLASWIRENFAKMPIGSVSTDKFLAAAGKTGKAAEMHLLKDEPGDAFKEKQRQYIAVSMANEAKRLEKSVAQFERTAKRMSAREPPGVLPEYANFIHDILLRVGRAVRRSVQDLQDAIARGEQKSLGDFVEYKELHDMREVPVAEFLFDPAFRKEFDSLTVEEFRAVHDSIKTLVKNGRDELKIIRAGEEADLAEVKAKMIEQLKAFKEKHYDAAGKRWLGPIPPPVARPLRTYLASHLQLESIFNRWDRGDPKGVFTQYIMRDLASAANFESALEKKYSRMLEATGDKANLRALVDNPIFIDPLSKLHGDAGTPMQFTRKNLRAILLNVGNDGNLAKLARGYDVKPEVIMQWLDQHATKEDWEWAGKIGNIFAEIKKEADTMYRELTGVEPENIPTRPVQTQHGTYEGWYYPIIYHPVFEGASKKLMGGDALEQDNYHRATTPRGYTKQRTGYAAPMALDLDMMPVRMRQMLHDIAMRPAVINASKIFYDKDVRSAITKHYGLEYKELLVPYLRDVANAANYRSDAQSVGAQVSEFARQNMIATLIGLNPGTVFKHAPTAAINSLTEVGPVNFLRAVKGLASINEATGETNWRFAMDTSEELQRRHRHFRETLGGAQDKVLGEETLRESIIRYGSYPVAITDLWSAVPTWLAEYSNRMHSGADHGEAVFSADRAVRRAHGSTVVTNRPGIVRSGPLGTWLASLYGFFNHIMNRQYELMWKAGDTLDLVKQGEFKEASKHTGALTAGLFSYVLLPALIEELVTPLPDDHHESWAVKAAKGLTYTISASWIGIRDLASAILRARDPAVGLLSTAYKTVSDVARDLSHGKETLSKARAGNIILHGATLIGAATGLMNAQEGKIGKFLYNYYTGQERPKGPWGWMVGARFGTLKHHTQTFEEWINQFKH